MMEKQLRAIAPDLLRELNPLGDEPILPAGIMVLSPAYKEYSNKHWHWRRANKDCKIYAVESLPGNNEFTGEFLQPNLTTGVVYTCEVDEVRCTARVKNI